MHPFRTDRDVYHNQAEKIIEFKYSNSLPVKYAFHRLLPLYFSL